MVYHTILGVVLYVRSLRLDSRQATNDRYRFPRSDLIQLAHIPLDNLTYGHHL